jgi:endogenous inhibitor of DNA gyrase (YacG/DUF329 family)
MHGFSRFRADFLQLVKNDHGDHAQARQKVACPTCGRLHPYETRNPFRPFCSERCKMIDLGQWANEEYRVPVSEEASNLEDSVPD